MKLIAVTGDSMTVDKLADTIAAIKDKIDFLQIREKSKTAREIFQLLDYLRMNGVNKEKIILNDRLDIALLRDIPNLHLPEHGLPVKIVKEQYPHLRVGCSVHSFEKAKEAEADGADYVIYGHCFETSSKSGIPPNGILPIEQMKRKLHIPVYGIGGISLNEVSLMKQSKADGIAIMSGIFHADAPSVMAKKYREAISK
ncbi:thiamine phosphate synthase [Oceanobacillus sp. FSL K6-2867]|uniref:thiamine phosphate synthase n=1 Tax=Oceanobacillus sp. FSL K6-2867 TaxID=2954748 RepID=UPI0030DD97A0